MKRLRSISRRITLRHCAVVTALVALLRRREEGVHVQAQIGAGRGQESADN
jgi:hypothetical protein